MTAPLSAVVVLTSTANPAVNAANTGAGFRNADQTVNVFGTFIGVGQTTQSVVEFTKIGVTTVSKWVPGVGLGLSAASIGDSAYNIANRPAGTAINQSDVASIVSNVAAGTGAALVLVGASGPVVIGLAVIAVGAGVYQLVATAKGWTAGGVEVQLTPDQMAQTDVMMKNILPLLSGAGIPGQDLSGLGLPSGSKLIASDSVFVDPRTTDAFTTQAQICDATWRSPSSTFLTSNTNGTVTINSGGVLGDVLVVANAGKPASQRITMEELLSNNPNIGNLNQVNAGLAVQVPTKSADGTVNMQFASGANISYNNGQGTYDMTVPNNDGSGGTTRYQRTYSGNGLGGESYILRQTTVVNGVVVADQTGTQTGSDNPVAWTALVSPPAADPTITNAINLQTTTNTTPTATDASNADSAAVNANGGYFENNGQWSGSVDSDTLGNINTASGNQGIASGIATDGVRPGAGEAYDGFGNLPTDPGYDASTGLSGLDPFAAMDWGADMNLNAGAVFGALPVAPLILDLDGTAGVQLTSYADAPVNFDTDNDRTSTGQRTQEQTGWMAAGEGMIVHDLDGNGKIDGINETLSEYYNGQAGTAGAGNDETYQLAA